MVLCHLGSFRQTYCFFYAYCSPQLLFVLVFRKEKASKYYKILEAEAL